MIIRDNRKPQRALITGGAGFIGSHLSEALLEKGYTVTIIDDLSTGRFENIEHLVANPNFHFAIDTITNTSVLDRLVSECDVIFHLAAAVGVMLIVDQPVHTITTNIIGTEAVLQAALRYRAKVLIASTSEVYGKGNQIPFREDDDVVLGPTCRSRWGYAASKMVDEFLALAYYREKNLPVVPFRLFNVVGPRQTGQYGMVIPRFVTQALKGEALTVFGNGQQSHTFLHVHDAVNAIIALAESPQAVGEVFNIGATDEISMETLATSVISLVQEYQQDGKVTSVQHDDPNWKPIEYISYDKAYAKGFEDMRRRVPDIAKIKLLTGWEPKKKLVDILTDVITHSITTGLS